MFSEVDLRNRTRQCELGSILRPKLCLYFSFVFVPFNPSKLHYQPASRPCLNCNLDSCCLYQSCQTIFSDSWNIVLTPPTCNEYQFISCSVLVELKPTNPACFPSNLEIRSITDVKQKYSGYL